LDDPSLTMLIVAADMKNVKQCEGRIRTKDNIVYDVVDNYRTLETHWSIREKWYLKRGAVIVPGGILKGKNIKPSVSEKSDSEKQPRRFLKANK